MAKAVENTAMEIAGPIAERLGMYVVDTEFKKEGKEWFLRIYIDKENGVTIEDCEAFSRLFSDEIDKADPIEQNYCLEVSSPGADRVLKKEREFLYYIGREVEVKLYQAVNGQKEFTGILRGFQDKTAQIETADGLIQVQQSQAVYIRLAFAF